MDPNLPETIAKMRMDELRREEARYHLGRQVNRHRRGRRPRYAPTTPEETNAFTEEHADAASPEAEEMQREEATRGA